MKVDPLLGDLRKLALAQTALVQLVITLQRDLNTEVARKPTLKPVLDGLDRFADKLAALHQQFDAAMASLRARQAEIEHWFDTVMQSFEERYMRSMKTWALLISVGVAVAFNASVFDLYTNVSTDATLRAALVNQGQSLVKHPANSKNAGAPDAALTQDDIAALRAQMASAASEYEIFGFKPLWKAFGPWRQRNEVHDPQVGVLAWCGHWIAAVLRQSGRVLGWLGMALLLSVGAPFWEDALGSLFGIKNLLRRSGNAQDADQKGGGQSRP